MNKVVLLVLFTTLAAPVLAEEINGERALFNYQMYCQGCHAPEGLGAGPIPRLNGFVGIFLRTEEGREFLVRVPGAAASTLSDVELAEVLNWIIVEFGGDSVSGEFAHYSAQEVGVMRQKPLFEVDKYRAQLITRIFSSKTAE